ncbi:hypothetical protein LSAT2_022013 [Lamellibrachia satsuma]|nr:hypothetical protein LSAT2_022013 [Lamellibrachia satsuma]
MVLLTETKHLNPVVVLEQLPDSVLQSLRRLPKQDGALTDRHISNEGSLPCDVIRPTITDSHPRLPQTMLRIDGLLLGPGSCRVLDVWLPEPNLDDEVTLEPGLLHQNIEEQLERSHEVNTAGGSLQVATSGVTEQHAALKTTPCRLPTMQQSPKVNSMKNESDAGQRSSIQGCCLNRCPITRCSRLVSSVEEHLRKDHRLSKVALKRVMARTKTR